MQPNTPFCTCSRCGSEAVQKVSAIVNAGTWTGTSSSVAIGSHGDMALGSGFSGGATSLAAQLVPPSQPVVQSLSIFITGAVAASLPALLALVGLVGMSTDGNIHDSVAIGQCWMIISAFLFLTLFMLVRLATVIRRNAQARDLRPAWEHQMRLWDQLFYCGRCDSVFNPASGQNAPVGQMRRLLG